VTAVYRDKDGDPIGGGYTYVDFISGGGSASFEISIPDELKFSRIASTDLYYSF